MREKKEEGGEGGDKEWKMGRGRDDSDGLIGILRKHAHI